MLVVTMLATSSGTPRWRLMKRCMGPSLSTKSVLIVASKEEHQRRQACDALRDPSSSDVRICGAAACTSFFAFCVSSTPRSLNQPWILSSDWSTFAEMSPEWASAAEDEAEEAPRRQRAEQHEDRAADTRNAMALQPADRGSGDGADHGGEDDRHDDRRRLAEQPHEPDDDQHEPDKQPRREAQVHEPRGCCKPDSAL